MAFICRDGQKLVCANCSKEIIPRQEVRVGTNKKGILYIFHDNCKHPTNHNKPAVKIEKNLKIMDKFWKKIDEAWEILSNSW